MTPEQTQKKTQASSTNKNTEKGDRESLTSSQPELLPMSAPQRKISVSGIGVGKYFYVHAQGERVMALCAPNKGGPEAWIEGEVVNVTKLQSEPWFCYSLKLTAKDVNHYQRLVRDIKGDSIRSLPCMEDEGEKKEVDYGDNWLNAVASIDKYEKLSENDVKKMAVGDITPIYDNAHHGSRQAAVFLKKLRHPSISWSIGMVIFCGSGKPG